MRGLLALLIVAAGAGLLYYAVTGNNPLTTVQAALHSVGTAATAAKGG